MASNPYVNKVELADGRTLIDISGDTVTAEKMLSGTTAHDKSGAQVTGSIQSKSATSYNTSQSDQTIEAGQYLEGAQTIRKVVTSGISASNIKAGISVKVGDELDTGRIEDVTGTYTSDATAGQLDIRNGKSAYVNGSKVWGTMPDKAAYTYAVSASDQKISANQYIKGDQVFLGVKTSNISAANIKKGVNVKVGDSYNTGRLKNVTGTFTDPSTVSPGQTAAGAAQILSGYSAWVDGAEVQGSIPSQAAVTATPTRSEQTIVAAGKYTSGAIKVAAISGNYYTLEEVYPVGSLWATDKNITPQSVLGFGTWMRIRESRFTHAEAARYTHAQLAQDTYGHEKYKPVVYVWLRTA